MRPASTTPMPRPPRSKRRVQPGIVQVVDGVEAFRRQHGEGAGVVRQHVGLGHAAVGAHAVHGDSGVHQAGQVHQRHVHHQMNFRGRMDSVRGGILAVRGAMQQRQHQTLGLHEIAEAGQLDDEVLAHGVDDGGKGLASLRELALTGLSGAD